MGPNPQVKIWLLQKLVALLLRINFRILLFLIRTFYFRVVGKCSESGILLYL